MSLTSANNAILPPHAASVFRGINSIWELPSASTVTLTTAPSVRLLEFAATVPLATVSFPAVSPAFFAMQLAA